MRAEPLRVLAAATAVTGPSPCEQSAAPATPAAPAAPASAARLLHRRQDLAHNLGFTVHTFLAPLFAVITKEEDAMGTGQGVQSQ